MSWQLFEQSMLAFMNNPNAIRSSSQVGEKLATEYTSALERGFDTANFVTIKPSRSDDMRDRRNRLVQLFNSAFDAGRRSRGQYDIIQQLGIGVIAYWTGARLNEIPIPITPAIGATSNILVVENYVTVPGTWRSVIQLFPTADASLFIRSFIISARNHLQTVNGIAITTSIYPPLGTPAPGVVTWQGYTVP